MFVVAAVEAILLAAVVVLHDKLPDGFVAATLSIAVSAIFFLALISWLRRGPPLGPDAPEPVREQDRLLERRVTLRWTIILAAIMLAGTVAIWWFPRLIGQYFGSLIIACFSFGAFLAFISLCDLVAERLSGYAKKAGFAVSRPALATLFVCFLVVPALLASLTHAFHRVRICDEVNKCAPAASPKIAGWAPVKTPDERPSVQDAALAWYAQAEPVYHATHPGEPVPMLVVATAGGGIRAAYWTATILEQLEQDLGKKVIAQPGDKVVSENLLHNLLFAISGVSGGSVGAAAYAAAVHDHAVTGAPIKPTDYLNQDFWVRASRVWSSSMVRPTCCLTLGRSTAGRRSSLVSSTQVKPRAIRPAWCRTIF
jgi:hypothetical protein